MTAVGVAHLYRWKSGAWYHSNKSGVPSVPVDIALGVASAKVVLLGPDNACLWRRHLHLAASYTVEDGKKVIVSNGVKQFALHFDDKDHAARFLQRLLSALEELRATSLNVVKTKDIIAMMRDLERLKAEANQAKQITDARKAQSPLRASTGNISRARSPTQDAQHPHEPPSSQTPAKSGSGSHVTMQVPVKLRPRSIRAPMELSLPMIATLRSSAGVMSSPSASVDVIVNNVLRNTMKRNSSTGYFGISGGDRRASTPHAVLPDGLIFTRSSPRRMSLPNRSSWEMPTSYVPSKTSRSSSVSSSNSSGVSSSAPPQKHGRLMKTESAGAALTTKRDKIRQDHIYRSEIDSAAHFTPEQYVTHILKRNTDKAALNTFFLVFRRYITAEQLLDRIQKEFTEATNKSYRARLADIAGSWARDYYQEDFSSSEMAAKLFDLRNSLIGSGHKELEGVIPDIDNFFPRSTSMPMGKLTASQSSTSAFPPSPPAAALLPGSRSATTLGTSLQSSPSAPSAPGLAGIAGQPTPSISPTQHKYSLPSPSRTSSSGPTQHTRPTGVLPTSTSTPAASSAGSNLVGWAELLTEPSAVPLLASTSLGSVSHERLTQSSKETGDKGKSKNPLWRISREIFTRTDDQTIDNFITHHGVKAIARELTLLDVAVQQQLRPLDIASFKEDSMSPTIRHQADHFNIISYWVANEIVTVPNLSKRVHLLQTMISLASKLKKLQNFNGLMAVIAGLNTHSISRLKQTWRSLSQKHMRTFEELENFMDIVHNFRVYRHFLTDAQLPAVPYFGLVLRDITLLNEGSADVAHGEVNRDKISLLTALCNDIVRFRASKYPFKSVATLRQYFSRQEPNKDEDLERFSKLCEPVTLEVN